MPYITVRQSARHHQITLDDILNGEVRSNEPVSDAHLTGTVTHFTKHVPERFNRRINVFSLITELEKFNELHEELHKADRESLYHTFYIPKHSGGFRRIDQPNPELMEALRQLRSILETKMNALYHTSAFAYVSGRCAVDAVRRHQRNQSRWFLKIDFSNFFGSTTPEFLTSMLKMIYPFSAIFNWPMGARQLTKALDLCFLNGGLPQGTPISPMLTNLMMIPIDHRLCNDLVKQGFVYTRYADDILISGKYSFMFTDMCKYIRGVLEEFKAPFTIKPEKTRYGSSSGENWNLGVMLNKDNQITVGWKNKARLRSACYAYVNDKRNGKNWDLHDVHVLSGQISYYHMVEPEYIDGMIGHFNEQHSVNLMRMIKDDLRGRG